MEPGDRRRQDRLLPRRRHHAAARGAGGRHRAAARPGSSMPPTTSSSSPAASRSSASSSRPLMNPGDEVLYPNPGYPIYESQIEYHRRQGRCPTATCRRRPASRIDLDQVRSLITPATRAIVYNNLQNPISAESTQAEMEAIARSPSSTTCGCSPTRPTSRCATRAVHLDRVAARAWPSAPSILYTFSKKFAMTGWRLGCAIAPKPSCRRLQQAQHQQRVVHDALRPVGRARGVRRPVRRRRDPGDAAGSPRRGIRGMLNAICRGVA
jgi:hypothetical protein